MKKMDFSHSAIAQDERNYENRHFGICL